ncbi:cysteine-rich venom protein pseudechetoxin [Epinephelus moara]|uniref:cysteine-rich venom protein pseudechetoxin n=1 Tax=Epinephelus moara TaxID=300413 RepID=UPI00214E799D|nr:cysteine-rich venom protein pseudechetoxin [Epinephelus moara]
MFPFLICILTLQQVHSACVLVSTNVCPNSKTLQAEIVDHHNAIRRAVQPTASNMLQMSYSEEVAASAQAWVDKCILAHGPVRSRLYDGYQLGENLFYSSKPYPWTAVINAWHSEVARYQYPNGSTNGKPIGHYTQVVWNSSYKVGCGVKLCPKNIYFYGCHYYRAGNFRRWPPYKAGPPCASCPNNCVDKLCTNPCPDINHFLNCRYLTTKTGCSNKYVLAWCPASCKCPTEIIPIG